MRNEGLAPVTHFLFKEMGGAGLPVPGSVCTCHSLQAPAEAFVEVEKGNRIFSPEECVRLVKCLQNPSLPPSPAITQAGREKENEQGVEELFSLFPPTQISDHLTTGGGGCIHTAFYFSHHLIIVIIIYITSLCIGSYIKLKSYE